MNFELTVYCLAQNKLGLSIRYFSPCILTTHITLQMMWHAIISLRLINLFLSLCFILSLALFLDLSRSLYLSFFLVLSRSFPLVLSFSLSLLAIHLFRVYKRHVRCEGTSQRHKSTCYTSSLQTQRRIDHLLAGWNSRLLANWIEKKDFPKDTFDLNGPKINVLIRDKISFVGAAHLTRGRRSCSWELLSLFFRPCLCATWSLRR